MRIPTRVALILAALVTAGCMGQKLYPYRGAPKTPVAIRSVTFERELLNKDWKSLVDVACDLAGNAYVLDASAHRVYVHDPLGKPILAIGESGFFKRTFPSPSGVAVDSEGRILVSDAKNRSVQIFDRGGIFSTAVGGEGTETGFLRTPGRIDVDSLRNIYVVEQRDNRLRKFDPRGIPLMHLASGPTSVEKHNIGRLGGAITFAAPPQFRLLRDVALGHDGTIYLLDAGTCVVHAYNREGTYIFSFGGRGRGGGKFQKPSGIAVGALGVVCVTDEAQNTLHLFDSSGNFLTSVGGKGKGRGQFREPQGVGMSTDGKIFVADKGNRRVQVFAYAIPGAAPTVRRLDTPVRVAVFDFKDNNPLSRLRGYGAVASDIFVTALARRSNFEVIERKQLRKVLDEILLDQSGVVEEESAKRVGKILSVDIALAGSVAAFADGIEMDIRLLDVETGKVILADSLKASFEGQMRALIDSEALKLENAYITRSFAPFPPAGLIAEVGVRECTLTWTSSKESDLKGYRVYRASSPDGPFTFLGETKGTEWTDKGLEDERNYYYAITAVDTSGLESKQSAATRGGTCEKPAAGEILAKPVQGVKRVHLSWTDNEPNVSGYVVYRSSSPNGAYAKVGESRTPSFSERGFGDGQKYYYKIAKKYRSGLESGLSNPIAASTKPVPSLPADLRAEGGLARRVKLAWADPPEKDIREFRVYRSAAEDGEYRRVATVKPGWISSPSCTDEHLKDDATYYYTVEAVDKDGLVSPMSSVVKAATKPSPGIPRGLTAEGNRARHVPLAWEKNPENDIANYVVYSSDRADGHFRVIGKTAATSFDHSGLTDLTAYYYRIKAVDADGLESGLTAPVFATTKPRPETPRNLSAGSGQVKRVALSWAANPEKDIAYYIVSRAFGAGGRFKEAARVTAPGYTDTGLQDGTLYRYAVTAVCAEGLSSDPSEKAESKTKPRPTKPKGLKASVSGRKVSLEWEPNPESDIVGYELLRGRRWHLLDSEDRFGTVEGTRFVDSSGDPGNSYEYRIVAVDRDGLRSDSSNMATATISAAK